MTNAIGRLIFHAGLIFDDGVAACPQCRAAAPLTIVADSTDQGTTPVTVSCACGHQWTEPRIERWQLADFLRLTDEKHPGLLAELARVQAEQAEEDQAAVAEAVATVRDWHQAVTGGDAPHLPTLRVLTGAESWPLWRFDLLRLDLALLEIGGSVEAPADGTAGVLYVPLLAVSGVLEAPVYATVQWSAQAGRWRVQGFGAAVPPEALPAL